MTKNILHHPGLVYAADIKQICKPLSRLNINYFAHIKVTNQQLVSGMSNHPEFTKHYVEKKYYNADIHLANSNQFGSYVLWDAFDYLDQTSKLKEDCVAFGIDHVLTIIDNQSDEKNYYHFATNLLGRPVNQIYLSNMDLLKRFIQYFTHEVHQSSSLSNAYNMPFSIDPSAAGFCVNSEIPNPDQENIRELFIQETPVKHNLSLQLTRLLTKQEIICLQHYIVGKTSREISVIMGLAIRTVENYINNIKQKLHVSTKSELIFLCRFDF